MLHDAVEEPYAASVGWQSGTLRQQRILTTCVAVSLPYISPISIARQQFEPTSTHIRRNPRRLVKADDAFWLGSTIHSGDIPLCTDPQLCASQPPSAAFLPSAARFVDFTKAGVGRRFGLLPIHRLLFSLVFP
jgi:hypothetical protein